MALLLNPNWFLLWGNTWPISVECGRQSFACVYSCLWYLNWVLFWINPFLMACWKNVWGFLVLGMLFCADNHVHVNSSDLFSVFFFMFFNGRVKYFALQSGIYKDFESWVASAVVKKMTSIKLLTMEASIQLKAQLVISLG